MVDLVDWNEASGREHANNPYNGGGIFGGNFPDRSRPGFFDKVKELMNPTITTDVKTDVSFTPTTIVVLLVIVGVIAYFFSPRVKRR